MQEGAREPNGRQFREEPQGADGGLHGIYVMDDNDLQTLILLRINNTILFDCNVI